MVTLQQVVDHHLVLLVNIAYHLSSLAILSLLQFILGVSLCLLSIHYFTRHFDELIDMILTY